MTLTRGTLVATGPNHQGDTVTLAEKVLDLPRDEFRQLVDQDMRGKAPEAMSAALRDPLVLDRWCSVLLAMKKSIEGQLGAKREEVEAQRMALRQAFLATEQASLDAKALDDLNLAEKAESRHRALKGEYAALLERAAKTRAGMLRFKSGMEETLVEARRLRTAHLGERETLAERVRSLETAILAHRLTQETEDFEPSPADVKLWSIL